MVAQQLQHANEMTYATTNAVTLFEATAKLREAFRKLPVSIHIRVIHGSRAACECDQIVQWIKDFRAICVTSSMRGNQRVILNHFHMIDESLDRNGLECHLLRDAVADFVEADHLIFIDRHRFSHTGFEGVPWQRG